MNHRILLAPGVLLLVTGSLFAQSALTDIIKVTLPNAARVGDNTLPAGEYQIRQLPTASHARVLEFSTDQGTHLLATVTAVPVLDNNNRNETSVVLEQRGDQYYLKRIWIGGKNYGYEIPREGADASSITTADTLQVEGTYKPAEVQAAAAQPAPREETPAPPPTPEPVQEQPAPAQEQPTTTAQAEPPPQPQPEPAPQTPPAPVHQVPDMPQTSTDWAGTMALGILLAGAAALTSIPRRARQGR